MNTAYTSITHLDAKGVDRLIERTFSMSHIGSGLLDLSDVEFIDPYGCAVLVSLSRCSRDCLKVIPPLSPQVTSYMARIGLTKALESVLCGEKVPVVINDSQIAHARLSKTSLVLMEITPITTEDDVLPISKRLYSILKTNSSWGPTDISKVCTIVAELCQNIPQHSGSWGVACIQAYGKGLRTVKIGVSDLGVGVRSSLASTVQTTNHGQAILRALELGISGTGEMGRGMGLARVKEVVTNAGGRLDVRSGDARIRVMGIRNLAFNVVSLPGTHIGIELPG